MESSSVSFGSIKGYALQGKVKKPIEILKNDVIMVINRNEGEKGMHLSTDCVFPMDETIFGPIDKVVIEEVNDGSVIVGKGTAKVTVENAVNGAMIALFDMSKAAIKKCKSVTLESHQNRGSKFYVGSGKDITIYDIQKEVDPESIGGITVEKSRIKYVVDGKVSKTKGNNIVLQENAKKVVLESAKDSLISGSKIPE